MEFEWDEKKRFENIAKHAIDLADARTIWRGPVLDPIAERFVDGEHRALAIGMIGPDEIIIAVVYTLRGDTLRLISARRARRNERKAFQDRFGRGA